MEVKTVDDTAFSLRQTLLYGTITAGLIAVLLAPTLVHRAYPRVLNTLLLLGLTGLVARTLLSAALAFASPEPPGVVPSDHELPSVSVLVPAYNEEPVLPGTIEACKDLAYPPEKLEVVLCYEADSTDATGEICRAAAAEDDRFVAVERDEAGGGKAKATNYALQHATGDVIASIDADHRFRPDAIRRAVRWFLEDPDVWCVKGRCYGDNPTDSVIALHATVERHIAEKADLFARQVFDGFTIFGGGQAFFRAALFDELGEFDEEILVEDVDMSSKIHAAGKELVVDPGIITFEENPATLPAWWSQRTRWARGWMQVAARYLTDLPRNSLLSLRTKLDAVYTLTYAVVPAFLILSFPLGWMTIDPHFTTTTYVPKDWFVWEALGVAPTVASYAVFVQDYRDGLAHHPAEYLAAFTLWFYLALQAAVFVTAFIQEFVLRKPSVYVTTSRSGE